MSGQKPVHTIILDTGPILKNDPSIPTLIAQSSVIATVPSVLLEIKDASARARFDTFLRPFITIRTPRQQSLTFVADFAKRSGDYSVLSRTDLEVLALAYEVHIERHGNADRLRKFPGEKKKKGKVESEGGAVDGAGVMETSPVDEPKNIPNGQSTSPVSVNATPRAPWASSTNSAAAPEATKEVEENVEEKDVKDVTSSINELQIEQNAPNTLVEEPLPVPTSQNKPDDLLAPHMTSGSPNGVLQEEDTTSDAINVPEAAEGVEDSDSDGWITPANLTKQLAKDASKQASAVAEDTTIEAACMTTDFACQNVLLQIGLDLLSTSFLRIRNIKTYILRCHACFNLVKDTSKQFCPRCGMPTLTRVSCSTDRKGVFRIHLKKDMQWNHRGDRYAIPKPTHGSANGKHKAGNGGGKGGWGQSLILAEDQKEYQRAIGAGRGKKVSDVMSEDYLPSILTGERHRSNARPRVGAGRNVNARKRHA